MEDELAALVAKRESLEKELERETSVESEKAKIAELERKVIAREKELHPSKFGKYRKTLSELKTEWDKYKLKKAGFME
jgi:hypothetical protein